MQLEGHDVLYVNDLVTPYSLGLGFMPDYDPVEWVRTLQELEQRTNWTRMVGAHGIPVAPRDALSQRRRYLEALMAAVRQAIDDGKRMDALYDSIELPQEFKDLRGYNTQLKRAAERIYHFYTMGVVAVGPRVHDEAPLNLGRLPTATAKHREGENRE